MSFGHDAALSISNLTQSIRQATNYFASAGLSNIGAEKKEEISPKAYKDLLDASSKLVLALEGPGSACWKIIQGAAWHAALRTAYKMNIFDILSKGQTTMTAEELGTELGASSVLVVRIMRALACIGIFEETEESKYQHNVLSMYLGNPVLRTVFTGMLDVATPVMPTLPDFLASINFQNPDSAQQTAFNYAHHTDMHWFYWIQERPEIGTAFDAAMAATTALQKRSIQEDIKALLAHMGPLPENRGGDDEVDPVLFVDVGGGRGQILADIRSEQPELNGRMIIQDLQGVLGDWKSPGDVEVMAYDFFTPQPIKGACFYYFRHILHDWPDAECRQILRNTIPALVPNRSRIIIVDAVMSHARQPHYAYCALLDMQMMALGGMERTEAQWYALVESVGLKVVAMDHPPLRGKPGARTNDSIIEVMLIR